MSSRNKKKSLKTIQKIQLNRLRKYKEKARNLIRNDDRKLKYFNESNDGLYDNNRSKKQQSKMRLINETKNCPMYVKLYNQKIMNTAYFNKLYSNYTNDSMYVKKEHSTT
jgi:hypothetical protein